VLKEAQLISKAATDDVAAGEARSELETERADVTQMAAQFAQQLQAEVAQFMEAAAQAIVQIQATTAEAQSAAVAAITPRPKQLKMRRENGELVGTDGVNTFRVKRNGAELHGSIEPIPT